MRALDQSSVHTGEPDSALQIINQRLTAPVAPSVRLLTRDFLTWLASAPRTYAEAMEAWQTSCPRYSIWEDALSDDLIRLESSGGKTMGQAKGTQVTLTPRGRAVLDGSVPA